MAGERQLAFGSFRFDAGSGQLWREGREVRLTPRAAAVLRMLAERAGEVVSKQDLFDHVWDGLAVSDDALTSCIQELRGALGDDARRPRYIETRHRRGYRLMIGATAVAETGDSAVPAAGGLVGRAAELAELARAFAAARAGRRQVVFVTGEPGIGKTALADAFLDQLPGGPTVRIAQGQCLDHHGVGEPYLPLIEALTRLARADDGAAVKRILATQAPSWLAQMPSLWSPEERSVLETRGRATRERMMRELTHAVEAIAAETPLALKLEDIHWSDASTLDWLAHVARRPDSARLMVVATFRPADAAAAKAGLDRIVTELAVHSRCREIALEPLGLQAIETFLAARLGGAADAARAHEMAPLLLERTGGNPLFMTGIVKELAQRPATERSISVIGSIPHDVRRFIERQIDELDAVDRDLLMAASVVGRAFATTAVAAALEGDAEAVETVCARLARQAVFIVAAGAVSWPDGAQGEGYSFRHDLYRELLYARLAATRRALIHARVGRRLEAAWAGRLDVIASELAEHFERGGEPARAIPHRQRAAAKALRRAANQEAIGHLRRALEAIGSIADEIERTKIEVELSVALGSAFIATRGFGAPEVLEAYSRAETLCDRLGERVDLFPAIWGQWMFRTGRSETDVSRRLCQRLLSLAEKFDHAGLKIQAHHANWATSFITGKLDEAHAHTQAALQLFDPSIHHAMASSYGNHDAGCCARNFAAMSLALRDDEAGARALVEQSLAVVRTLGDPFSLSLTLFFTSAVAQMLGDVSLASANSGLSVQMATEHDLAQPKAWSMSVAGWCAVQNGDVEHGLALGTQAIVTMQAIHSRHFLVYMLGLLADAQLKAGRHPEAMKTVEEGLALADATGECFYDAELHRLRGELLARPPRADLRQAKASFQAAIDIARRQGAKTLQRKAEASLARCRA